MRESSEVRVERRESCCQNSSSSLLTFCLLGGVEPGACRGTAGGVGVRDRCADPGGDHEGRPDLVHQEWSQQVEVIQSHHCEWRGRENKLKPCQRKEHSDEAQRSNGSCQPVGGGPPSTTYHGTTERDLNQSVLSVLCSVV